MIKSTLIRFVILLALFGASTTFAARVEGVFLGVQNGNDTEALLETFLGLDPGDVSFLDKVETPDLISGDLTLSNIVFNSDSEPVSGWWDYLGAEIANILVVKAGNDFAAYDYRGFSMPNLGLWDTAELGNKGM